MLDRTLLDAIAHGQADSGLTTFLRRLLAELVSEAGVAGGQAIREALQTQPIVVTPPALPTVPLAVVPSRDQSAVSAARVPVGINQSFLTADVQPAVQQLLASVVDDVNYVGGQDDVAAVLARALVESEPKLIVDTLAALARGDLETALRSAVQAVLAPVQPLGVDAVPPIQSDRRARVAAAPQPVAKLRSARSAGQRGQSVVAAARSADGSDEGGTQPAVAPGGGADLSDGNKVAPQSTVRPGRLQKNVTAAFDSVRTDVGHFGDIVRKAVAPRSRTDGGSSPDN